MQEKMKKQRLVGILTALVPVFSEVLLYEYFKILC